MALFKQPLNVTPESGKGNLDDEPYPPPLRPVPELAGSISDGESREDITDEIPDIDKVVIQKYQPIHELISMFTSFYNSEKLEILDSELYDLCSKYVARHKRTMHKQEKHSQRKNKQDWWAVARDLTVREKIRLVFEEPQASTAAKIVHTIIFSFIIAATAALCLETIPRWNPEVFPRYENFWFYSELAITVVFTAEFLLRLLVAQSKLAFVKNFLNIVDFVAILPFYVELAIGRGSRLRFVRLVRLTRVFRVLKMTRRSGTSGKVLSRVLKKSAPALVIPAFFLVLGLVIISSALYFAERGDYNEEAMKFLVQDALCEARPKFLLGEMECPLLESKFVSIPDTMWWAVVTMTTVGYGDLVPQTRLGKFVAAVGMFMGIIFLAMPLTIVGGNFARVINEIMEERKLAKREALEAQLDKERDELEGVVRLKQLNLDLIDKQLDDLTSGLRLLLPALQVCNPKLHRHVDHFLELTTDIRSFTSPEVVQKNINRFNAQHENK